MRSYKMGPSMRKAGLVLMAVLGSSPTATFLRVTLRLTAPAAAAGASLVFVAVATELTATLLLAPETHGASVIRAGRVLRGSE